mmetsp:Transcript_75413/g.213308  ORF Transcript_75413/g.213308 Transcript_75413/m.213308 type:complete len:276 (+) Transcript_75413:1051-1878(+)
MARSSGAKAGSFGMWSALALSSRASKSSVSCSSRRALMTSERRPEPLQTTIGHPWFIASSSCMSEIFPPLTRIMTRGTSDAIAAGDKSSRLARLDRLSSFAAGALSLCKAEATKYSNSARNLVSVPKALPPTFPLSMTIACVWFSWISVSGMPLSVSGGSPSPGFASAASTFSPLLLSTLRHCGVRPPRGLIPKQGTWRRLSCCFIALPTMSITPLLVPPVITQAPVRRAASTRPLEKLSMSNLLLSVCMLPAPPMIERIRLGVCSPHSGRITSS